MFSTILSSDILVLPLDTALSTTYSRIAGFLTACSFLAMPNAC